MQKPKHKVKQTIPMMMVAGATLLSAACQKPEPEPTPDPEPTKEIEIKFNINSEPDEVASFDLLQEYINDKTVKSIYLVPERHWNGAGKNAMIAIRKNFLQPRIELSPKIRGRGDFDFILGEASKAPEDSLWYVQHGWTINKNHQK